MLDIRKSLLPAMREMEKVKTITSLKMDITCHTIYKCTNLVYELEASSQITDVLMVYAREGLLPTMIEIGKTEAVTGFKLKYIRRTIDLCIQLVENLEEYAILQSVIHH